MPSGGATILLVEDDPLVRNMTSRMLGSLGYAVLVAESPRQALALCQGSGRAIDLLMTDVVMPQMNGAELQKKILALRPDLKVLFMSGYTSTVIGRHGVLEEGMHFLQKPFTRKALAEKINTALASGGGKPGAFP